MIEYSSTVPAKEVAGSLFDLGIDTLIIGNNDFGLRLPTDYNVLETQRLTETAHQLGKKVVVAANAILHNDKLLAYEKYLADLLTIGVDYVMVGDAGAVNLIQEKFPSQKFIYNGEVLDTNSGMINFWGNEGASYVRIARELPYVELEELIPKLQVPPIMQLFGPIAIEHSARSLIYNYLDYENKSSEFNFNQVYHVNLPQKPEDIYTMFEDQNGTHMYGPEDLNLLEQLPELVVLGICHYTFDSKFYPSENWLSIMEIFIRARKLLESGESNFEELNTELKEKLPADRKISTGFYHYQLGDIK
ncbi:peptidase U32 family protein [Xylocopilactobacillus apicola]|nr:peptidase U32 family protein [Xylocopilactobacillus apicola]